MRRGRRLTGRRAWQVVAGYGLLLGLSHLVRATRPDLEQNGPYDRALHLTAVEGDRLTPQPVRLVYRDYGTRKSVDSPPIILIHGSPGSKRVFDELARGLADTHRVIAPDLPGFGGSTPNVRDYSFRAHAHYLVQLLDRLDIRQAHVVGFSMGGGVALNLVHFDERRIASLVLLSAIGVQEMELLGSYHLNHVVHGAQLGAIWLLREVMPHMGLFDRLRYGLPYARNFFDSDQRPLRGVLMHVAVPTLIIHGRRDVMVPVEAAFEHARLVPQSELRLFDESHVMLTSSAPMLTGLIGDFTVRVERGEALTRKQGDPARLRDSKRAFDPRVVPRARAVTAAVLAGLLGLAAIGSADVASISAGVLVAQGRAGFMLAVGGCFLGVLFGAAVRFRERWYRTDLALSSRLHRAVLETMVVGRSGSHGEAPERNRWHEWGSAVLAGAVSTPILAGLGALAGSALLGLGFLAGAGAWVRALAVSSFVSVAVWALASCSTFRGRRLLLSRWRRLTRWEFWPPWVFYPPVIAYLVYLMLKFRSATVFTAANPAILAGGFVGESKFDILQRLSRSGDRVARSLLIDAGLSSKDKLEATRRFMAANALDLPVVLKPNEGQRGSGVVIAHSPDELARCLSQSVVDTIVQEYAPGLEFGVFYCRRPSESAGRIISVTEKTLLVLIGDGRSTLEELILGHDRAVCMARFHCRRHRRRLKNVPRQGECVPLGELGTHCRGAMFLDGRSLLTPALELAFDGISKTFEGFYFGRFDVRAESRAAFTEGRGFKVIELNGVTSEATHIYDPATSLWKAYRVLFEQWRIAFEIGAENRLRGVTPASIGDLVRLLGRYRKTARFHLDPEPGVQPS